MAKLLRVNDGDRCIGCYSCMFACARIIHKSYSPRFSAVRVQTQGGLQGKFSVSTCRGCSEPLCAQVCTGGALTARPGGGVKFESENCSSCGKCAGACTAGVIAFEQGLPVICLQCGVCAEYCPHRVLSFENSEDDLC